MIDIDRYETPDIGSLLLAARDGALVAIAFIDDESDPQASLPPSLRGESFKDTTLTGIRTWLDRFFAGEAPAIEDCTMPLAPEGTEFDHRVWNALREIPYGETCSYGDLAERIGAPTAARAVGHANGRNPLPILIPCHRVVGASGKLTGFGGGLDRKQRLLDREAPLFATP